MTNKRNGRKRGEGPDKGFVLRDFERSWRKCGTGLEVVRFRGREIKYWGISAMDLRGGGESYV